MKLNDGSAAASDSQDEDLTPTQVGAEIRDLRKAKRLTIKELSLAASVSVGHLSEIERGIASPSIKTLKDIAKALSVTIGWFLHNAEGCDPAEREHIVRADNRRILRFASGVTDELLSPNLRGQLELVMSRFPPGTAEAEPAYSHQGEEAGLVLSGSFELWIGEQHFTLQAGDSFSFPSTTPHRYSNPGDVEAVVIWAITPPTY
ncbi:MULTISPECIES: cupin domain-containing protein [unclassified Hyphomicrobium]|uniref:cupin domain-containing protein n=1 Tax=unclassified Hyphomicrobium TaxID=2619925 RepID=UPI000213F6F5|nr:MULTISPECIES: cupin domain-containing protein [unclassified Hyphomicrobium]CCB66801.1 Transcriptional regulator, XRE family [Hyphomicrobium sp. MC1]